MLKDKNNNFYDILFSDKKIISHRNTVEKNISEQLHTIRTLVLIAPLENEMQDYVQLEKILAACKLRSADYFVLQKNTQGWNELRQFENIQEVLLFGNVENTLNIPILIAQNQIIKFDKRVFIKSSGISEMASNQQIKNDLWLNALKPHFVDANRQD